MWQPVRKTIVEILRDSTAQYSIPSYQRPYSWGEENATELIEDLRSYPDAGEENLFLGNLIFEKQKKEMIFIIDGQQRLTTIMLLLVACRVRATELKLPGLATKIQEKITFTDPYKSEGDLRTRLIASESIRETFENITKSTWDGKFLENIGGKSVKRQVNKLKPIYGFFQKELAKEKTENDLGKFLKALDLSYVVQITIENDTEALTIFERTNARGKDLEISDLLKNYLFAEKVKGVEDLWPLIIENSCNTMLRMLKYFYVSRKGYVTKPQLYKMLKKFGENVGAQVLTNELLAFSSFYRTIREATDAQTKQYFEEAELLEISGVKHRFQCITAALQGLREFNVVQFCPVVYAAIQCLIRNGGKGGAAEAKALVRLFQSLEKYHFVNNAVCERVGNEVEKLYAEYCVNYSEATDFIKITQKFISELSSKERLATEKEFESRFTELVYAPDSLSFLAYIFDRFNNHGIDPGQWNRIYDPDSSLKRRNHNIEHFMPQKPEAVAGAKQSSPEWVNKIGNLLPLYFKTNSKLQNKSPQKKIELLKNEFANEVQTLPIIKEFIKKYEGDASSWDQKKVEARAAEMAQQGYRTIWKVT